MKKLLDWLGYTFLGFFIDLLIVVFYRAIQLDLKLLAMILSFVISVIPFLVVMNAINRRQVDICILYSFGSALGTYTGLLLKLT